MGRHSLRASVHPGGPRHACRRSTPVVAGAAPTALAAALLAAVATGPVALADEDDSRDRPPGDAAASLLGGVLGTGDNPPPDVDSGRRDGASKSGSPSGRDPDEDEDEEKDAENEDADDKASGSERAGGRSGSLLGVLPAPRRSAENLPAPADVDQLVGGARVPVGKGASGGPTKVTLSEKNDSGVSGSGTVDEDRVIAKAAGLDPDARYASFFYGATSSATNNNPCILDGTNPLPGEQTIGEWEVDEDGNGTLRAENPLGARYRLQAGTMSIRKVEHDFSDATALPVNPLSYSLVACGEVERLEILDPVTNVVPKLPKLPSIPPLS